MTPKPPSPPLDLDLLIVGALTIDRLPDGSSAAGGSVLHAASALAGVGRRVGILTASGSEPVAVAGRKQLRHHAALLHVEDWPATVTFQHAEVRGARRLTLLSPAGRLVSEPLPARPAAVLYAPVAGELDAALGGQRYDGARTGAILQGWLRSIEPGEEVRPLPLHALHPRLLAALGSLDLLVASREDLAAVAPTPTSQLTAVRDRFGSRPALVVTDGAGGAWIDLAGPGESARWHLPAPHVIAGADPVGAGDALAAALLADWPGAPSRANVSDQAQSAMRMVASFLQARAGGGSGDFKGGVDA